MLELYVEQAGRRLRCGYTTGACAAAAAKAAAELLLSGCAPQTVSINTPKGVPLTLDVLKPSLVGGRATCAIQKDSGDDPDVTNGVLVYAAVENDLPESKLMGEKVWAASRSPGLTNLWAQRRLMRCPAP